MAARSWRPQSHLTEPNTSPVMHCEWMRTALGLSGLNSPLTSATNSSAVVNERKPTMRNSPVSVGRRASAIRLIVLGARCASAVRYKFISVSVMIAALFLFGLPPPETSRDGNPRLMNIDTFCRVLDSAPSNEVHTSNAF
jgi:hypothetical protein